MLELQRLLLADRARNDAFYKALKKIIIPDKTTVADIGSGTGFLSFLARSLGAKKCYLYEESPELLALSLDLARTNKITGCEFITGHSTRVKNPARVDIVISETLGNFALEEHLIENLNDGRRFVKPDGVMIPAALEQYIAPVTNKRLFDEINIWDRVGFNLNFDAAKKCSLNNMFVKKIMPRDMLDAGKTAQTWDSFNFTVLKNTESIRAGSAEWRLNHETPLYGFAVWWKCMLAPGIFITTSPLEKITHWDQVFLPLTRIISAKKGDILKITIQSDSRYKTGLRVDWQTTLKRNGKEIENIRMSTNEGIP